MAFCTSCGSQVAETAQFCTHCGKPLPGVAAAQASPSTPAPAPAPIAPSGGGSSAVKIVLIVAAVVVALGIISAAITGWVGYRMVRHARVEHTANGSRVSGGFGSVETTTDPNQLAQALSVDVYPGAKLVKEGSSVRVAGMTAASAEFETDDTPGKVADFYKSKFPDATVNDESHGEHSIVVNSGGWLAIHIRPSGGKTRIEISRTR